MAFRETFLLQYSLLSPVTTPRMPTSEEYIRTLRARDALRRCALYARKQEVNKLQDEEYMRLAPDGMFEMFGYFKILRPLRGWGGNESGASVHE